MDIKFKINEYSRRAEVVTALIEAGHKLSVETEGKTHFDVTSYIVVHDIDDCLVK